MKSLDSGFQFVVVLKSESRLTDRELQLDSIGNSLDTGRELVRGKMCIKASRRSCKELPKSLGQDESEVDTR